MSALLDRIRERARLRPRRLVLAEEDERVVRAADRLAREHLAEVTLVARGDQVRAVARQAQVTLAGVRLVDGAAGEEIERARAALVEARGDRLDSGECQRLARDPLFQAAARVREGLADCLVAGASRTTAEVLRAALWLLGTAPGVRLVSSFFLMEVPDPAGGSERVFLFADCGVVPDPDADQLAEIACVTADSYERLTGAVPRTALLSFSTRGSAEHPRVLKVREAVRLARSRRPDRDFDGELQADAALDPGVARRKAQGSAVAGRANVLIFPDLDAGNIGYKLVERLANGRAYGPILQGLAKQANDLSRGCSAEDVVVVSTIACALAGEAPAARGAGSVAREGP